MIYMVHEKMFWRVHYQPMYRQSTTFSCFLVSVDVSLGCIMPGILLYFLEVHFIYEKKLSFSKLSF